MSLDQDSATMAEDEARDAPLTMGPELAGSVNFRIRMAQILAFRSFEKKRPGYGGAARYLGLLSIIRANPGEAQHRLAEAVGLQRSSLVPILDRMEAEGIVERRDMAEDRRAKAVVLTPKGEEVVDELQSSGLALEEATLDGFSEAETAQLIEGLDRVIANLRKL